MKIESFKHYHGAHCESSVISNLLTHYGLSISEPMAFGLSSALNFTFIPFVRIGGIPLTAFRIMPRKIISRLRQRLGIRLITRRYRNPAKAERDLNAILDSGRIVGLQTSVYWLPYFPDHFRFHFNAHNIIVFGKDAEGYCVSDPILEDTVSCSPKGLEKARFARGAFAPKGFMYYPDQVGSPNLCKMILPSIRTTIRQMLYPAGPIAGIKGMRCMARTIQSYPEKSKSLKQARLDIGSIIRMQEEIGTGGGGFRFIYASFLKEAGTMLGHDYLDEASRLMTQSGDKLREFAICGARIIKKKDDENSFLKAADCIRESAEIEDKCFRLLRAAMKSS